MNKHLLIVFVAILFSYVSMAQVANDRRVKNHPGSKLGSDAPHWVRMGTPFVAYSVTGDTLDLQAILNSGKGVVMAYAVAGSQDCWDFHTSGILQAIDQLDSVQVIWVEEDNTNTAEAIFGNTENDVTRGDWTRLPSGGPVSYPLVDDNYVHSCLRPCVSQWDGLFPAIFFISPTGYFCDVFYKSYGFSYDAQPAEAAARIQALMRNYPDHNQAPLVWIDGPSGVKVNDTAFFTADYVSLDSVLAIEWRATNYSGFTQTGSTAFFVWDETTPQRVILTVTNTTGSSSDTIFVNVNDWHWGDEMTYAFYDYSMNIGSVESLSWGVRFPAQSLVGRNYIDFAQLYTNYSGLYRMRIYQTAPKAQPDMRSPIYDYSYLLAEDSGYHVLPLYDVVPINSSLDLWVTFTCPTILYPATATSYCGDTNSCMVYWGDRWIPVNNVTIGGDYYSWMIKLNTRNTPALYTTTILPDRIFSGQPANFRVYGTDQATYEWTFDGAAPSSAIGHRARVTWPQGGTYQVGLRATSDFDTLEYTYMVDVLDCNVKELPYHCGFDSLPDVDCWRFYDVDGDGHGWEFASKYSDASDTPPIGLDCIGSASYINSMGPLRPDNWLVSPELSIPSEGATLSYQVAGGDANYFNDIYSILVSTSGDEVGDFTDTLFTGVMPAWNWSRISYDLSAYAGQHIHIALRHHSSYDIFWIFIDDFKVVPGNNADIHAAPFAPVAVVPNPTSGRVRVQSEDVRLVNVMDANGRVVQKSNGPDVDMSSLPSGIYFVRVVTNSGSFVQKVVKR